jgi:hypothetical protein
MRVPVTTTSCNVVSGAAVSSGPAAVAAKASGANPTLAAAAPAVPTASPTACLIVKLLDIFGAPSRSNSRSAMQCGCRLTGIARATTVTVLFSKFFLPQTLNVAILLQVQFMWINNTTALGKYQWSEGFLCCSGATKKLQTPEY